MTFQSPIDGTEMLLTPEMSIEHQVKGRVSRTITRDTQLILPRHAYGCTAGWLAGWLVDRTASGRTS